MVQYLLESTVCSAVLYLLYSQLKSTLGLRAKRWCVLLLPLLCVVIPSIEFGQIFNQDAVLGQLSEDISIKEQLEQNVYAVILTIADVLLIGYFLVVAVKGFRLTDAIWKVFDKSKGFVKSEMAGAQAFAQFGVAFDEQKSSADISAISSTGFHYWQAFDVILIQLLSTFLWFNPFVYQFRKELFTTHQSLVSNTSNTLATSPLISKSMTCALVPTLLLLLTLFSFDLSKYLPGSHLGSQFITKTERILDYKLFEYDKRKQSAQYLEWGKLIVPLDELKATGGGNHLEMFAIPTAEFQRVLSDSLFIKIGEQTFDINQLSANIVTEGSPVLLYSEDLTALKGRLNSFSPDMEFSVYLSLKSEDEQAGAQQWLGAFSVSDKQRSYHTNFVWRSLVNRWISVETNFAGTQITTAAVQSQIASSSEGTKLSLHWGDVTLALNKSSGNSQYYEGKIEITRDQLPTLLKQPLTFKEGNIEVPLNFLELYKYAQNLNTRTVFSTEVKDDKRYIVDYEKHEDGFLATFSPGSSIMLMGNAGEHHFSYVRIKIHDPYELYYPEINVGNIQHEKPTWQFQVVTRRGGKTILKIDTLNPDVQHILEMYDDREKFDIRHISGFETRNRLIYAYKNQLGIDKAGDYISDIHLYPEYYGYLDKAIEVRWGDLAALPTSPIIPTPLFAQSKDATPSLWIDNQRIKIISGALLKQEKDSVIREIAILDWRNFETIAQPFLADFNANGSLYLDDLVIDINGQRYFLPIPFAFHIDRKNRNDDMIFDFERTTQYPGLPEKIETDSSRTYINYPLTALIADLFGTNPNRMVFENLPQEEYINLTFQSPHYQDIDVNTELGTYIANIYHHTIYSETIDLINWQLSPSNTELLDALVSSETVPESEKIDAFGNGLYLLKDMTPHEIGELIQDKLDIVVGTRWYGYHLESRFNLTLDLSSELAAKESLEAYGFAFEQQDQLYHAQKITFGQTRSFFERGGDF